MSRRPYKAVVGSVTAVITAIRQARANMRTDYELERRMSVNPEMPHNLLPREERCQWTGVGQARAQPREGEDAAGATGVVTWEANLTKLNDPWADLADSVLEHAQLSGMWGVSDGQGVGAMMPKYETFLVVGY